MTLQLFDVFSHLSYVLVFYKFGNQPVNLGAYELLTHKEYIPRNTHTVHALLCFTVVWYQSVYQIITVCSLNIDMTESTDGTPPNVACRHGTRPASPIASDMSSDWGAYANAYFMWHMFVKVFIYVYAYASPSKLITMLVWLQMFTWFYNENLECILSYSSNLVLTNIYSSQILFIMMKFMFTLSFTWKFYPF